MWPLPAAIAVTESSPIACTGQLTENGSSPFPSCPASPRPHPHTVPSASSAAEKFPPFAAST